MGPTMILDYDNRLILHLVNIDPDDFTNRGFYKIYIAPKVEKIIDDVIEFKSELVYLDYKKIGGLLRDNRDKFNCEYAETDRLTSYINARDLHINERSKLGIELKTDISNLLDRYEKYKTVVNNSMVRPLREKQMRDSFFMYAMDRSGNFSVPGSGKTAAALGVYAFMKASDIVDRVVMIGPKNAFGSWIDEFNNSFGEKETLRYFNIHDSKFTSKEARRNALVYDSGNCNLFLFNYESLNSYVEEIKKVVSKRTLLVFDEVHRVKMVGGNRAKGALAVSKCANHIIAMTGTPIPNSYKDIYNLLHILYNDEYREFFGFDVGYLNAPSKQEMIEINNRIQPFFCRTSKEELLVPKANDDILVEVDSSEKEQLIFDVLRKKYRKNHLVLFIRLLQLETNPDLLLEKLDFDELSKVFDIDLPEEDIDYVDYSQDVISAIKGIDISTKKIACVKKVRELVDQRKKVIVWCYFTDSITSLRNMLSRIGMNAKVIYGEVALEDRMQLIDSFKSGEFDVLITNPHTLAESVSLHTVCHDAIYYEYSYNLVHLLQSKDRIHRLGLPEGQYTQYYFMESMYEVDGEPYSFDQRIYDRLKYKEEVMLDAIDNHILEPVYTTEEDLAAIFGSLS